jgi:hypothetical protein
MKKVQEADLYEAFLKDLVWAVKSDVGNAIMGNSSPGRVLYNMWKSGDLYKDEKSPYSKKVSWYDEGAIKTKAREYDNTDKVTGAALKKVSDIKKKFGTKINTEELGKNKEYLTAYIDYLTKETQSLIKLHSLRLALGMREKSNPYGLSVPVYDDEGRYKGESVDKALLLKKFPKEWVDEMDMDKPVKISTLVGEYKQKIQTAKEQLSKLSESVNETNMKKVKEEYKGKHQGSNYKWPMSQATKDRKEADKFAGSDPKAGSTIKGRGFDWKKNELAGKIKEALDQLKEEKPGLWANIRAKRARGEKPSHKNSNAHKDAVKAGKKINKDK